MSNDLKSYIKSGKNTKESQNAQAKIENLSKKSQAELNSDFQTALAKAKKNGTFNKNEMLEMLCKIKGNMPQSEFLRISQIINSL